ncbi:hypothetical protein K435DRAFT_779992 [Dendrothele bispora CBS 962.96]|uniref:Uncharacterized protein n=1 Tax=Dendrothele bispora (strain CBS 962.96) TaxID=1314807 RepID=A0A4S8LUI0_DENBC|nr:hypothetical protein K435DRAFT_785296 [Dendrothele bispora CBS 962.96]THU93040.1 hypothetical protein K435DRAFT_779992 [Dendrothele bispora CBS 962.96]
MKVTGEGYLPEVPLVMGDVVGRTVPTARNREGKERLRKDGGVGRKQRFLLLRVNVLRQSPMLSSSILGH